MVAVWSTPGHIIYYVWIQASKLDATLSLVAGNSSLFM